MSCWPPPAAAGLDTESTVAALPVGQSLYAYWADNRVLTELLQSDAALDDLRAATWEEWFDFVTAVTQLVRGTRRCAGNAERQCLHPAR